MTRRSNAWGRGQRAVVARSLIVAGLVAAAHVVGGSDLASAQASATNGAPVRDAEVEAALALARDAEPADRMRAQAEIVAFGDAAVPVLQQAIRDLEAAPMTRRIAAWSLAEIEGDAACSAVHEQRAAEDDIGTRVAFALARARCGASSDAHALLADPEAAPAARLKVALWLALESDASAYDVVAAMPQDPAFDGLQTLVVLTLGLLGEPQAMPTLEAMRFQVETRPYAAIALLRMGERAASVDVRLAVDDADPSLRFAALRALAEAHVEGTLPLLIAASNDVNPRIARYAAREARLWRRRSVPR